MSLELCVLSGFITTMTTKSKRFNRFTFCFETVHCKNICVNLKNLRAFENNDLNSSAKMGVNRSGPAEVQFFRKKDHYFREGRIVAQKLM